MSFEDWEEVRLGDVLFKIIGGGTPSKNKKDYWNGNIYWCSVKDMIDGKYHLNKTQDKITKKGLENSASNLILKNTLIIATRMGLGRAFISGSDMAINQDLKALVPNEKITMEFLLWTIILNSSKLENLGTGATVKGIRLEILRSLKINLPPLKTQKKIAKILSNYDDLIENNLQQIKLLEEKARLTYQEWFLRFRIDGVKLEIDDESGLPFGWERKKITNIANINEKSISKKTAPKEIKYIDIASTETGYFQEPEKILFENAPSRARRILRYGDIIFSTVRPNRKTYSLILDNDNTLIASTGFVVLSPIEIINYAFIYLSISNQKFIDSVVAVATGATYPAINQKDFEKLKIVIPKKFILEKFSKLAIPMLELKNNLLNQNQNLKEARDILLPRLMTGIIEV